MSEVKNKQEAIQPKVENESKTIVTISAPGGMNNFKNLFMISNTYTF